MAKASPAVRSFNGGEFSELMEGRTDVDRYPASTRRMLNAIATPQGPFLSRSGTLLSVSANNDNQYSGLVPFIFSNEQAKMLEFGHDRVRFVDEGGIQVYDADAFTISTTSPFAITCAGLTARGAVVGDQIVLGGYAANYNLDGEIVTITEVNGNVYTLDKAYPALASAPGTAQLVYRVLLDFTEAERRALRVVHSVDVMYLLTGSQPRKLSRYGTYDWRLEYVVFVDGPYMPINETSTKLTPSITGNAVPDMTANTAPAGTASGNGNRPALNSSSFWFGRDINWDVHASDYFMGFNSEDRSWGGDKTQEGILQYDFGSTVSIDGYVIYMARENQDLDYLAKDYAPSTWTFEGSANGSAWTVLDTRDNYVLWDHNKSIFFELDDVATYRYFRINIIKLFRNGPIEPRIRRLVLRSTGRGVAAYLSTAGATLTNATSQSSRAFNGTESEGASNCAQKSAAASNSMYIGKTITGKAAVLSARVCGSNDTGFTSGSGGGSNITLTLYGKNGAAPANGTDGTVLGTITFTDASNESAGRVISSSDTTTYYDHVWVNLTQGNNQAVYVAELRITGWPTSAGSFVTITASSIVGINRDTGFQSTDVGRLIRLKCKDNYWRVVRINSVTSTTVVNTTLEDEPFSDLKGIKEWRLGYWSDTTGWPNCGDFFEDRLALAGPREYPDQFALSVTGFYETFRQTDTAGVVLDESAVVGRINGRRLSGIRWLSVDEKGLLIGTGSGEYILASAKGDLEAVTARNIKSRNSTSRGSADVEAVKVDRQLLYVQRSGRTLREFAFSYEADGYRSPSMSQLASHLGTQKFAELDYAAEPHGIVWVRREDGSLVGMTYNREENVVGWHRHDLSGGYVESMAVMPAMDQSQDTLWLVVRRTIDGVQKKYIEYVTRFWDFDMELADAHFVDCGLRYEGDPLQVLYGLQHLEGCEVYGLADDIPFGPLVVANGSVELPAPASRICVGLGYDSEVEISRLENGAQDGTALGKTARIHNSSVMLWRSYGGEIGVWVDEYDEDSKQLGKLVFTPVEYPTRADVLEDTTLYTGEVGPIIMPASYEKRKTVTLRRPKKSPLPFNAVALLPQLVTQDR